MIPFGLTPFRFYAYIGIAVAFAAVLTFGGCEHMNANNLRADNKVLEQSVKSFENSQKSNLKTIDVLKEKMKGWIDLATTSQAIKEAAAKAAEFEKENQKLSAQIRKREEKDYAKPECNKLFEIEFESACPGVADGMRERAGRHDN